MMTSLSLFWVVNGKGTFVYPVLKFAPPKSGLYFDLK